MAQENEGADSMRADVHVPFKRRGVMRRVEDGVIWMLRGDEV